MSKLSEAIKMVENAGKKSDYKPKMDEVGKFWVVVDPSSMKQPTLADICFETDLPGIYLQFTGGLTFKEVYAVIEYEHKAKALAEKLLKEHEAKK